MFPTNRPMLLVDRYLPVPTFPTNPIKIQSLWTGYANEKNLF